MWSFCRFTKQNRRFELLWHLTKLSIIRHTYYYAKKLPHNLFNILWKSEVDKTGGFKSGLSTLIYPSVRRRSKQEMAVSQLQSAAAFPFLVVWEKAMARLCSRVTFATELHISQEEEIVSIKTEACGRRDRGWSDYHFRRRDREDLSSLNRFTKLYWSLDRFYK